MPARGSRKPAKAPKRKKPAPTLNSLTTRLDDVLSLWIRQKDADRQSGIVLCCSCGAPHHWKDVDMGHFIPKSQGAALRWDERNVAPQCKSCNGAWGKPMNASGYAVYLIKRYGSGILESLESEKRQVKKWSRSELEDLISSYKSRLEALGHS